MQSTSWFSMRRLVGCLLAALAFLLAPAAARAQFTLQLTPTQTVFLPGESAPVTALLTYNGTGEVSLLGTSLTTNGPDPGALSVDVTDFESNLPFSLASGESYSGNLFVAFTGIAPDGAYTINYAVDGFTTDFVTAPATINLQVGTVATSVPEPSSLLLAAAAAVTMLPVGSVIRRRRNP